jgi:hypothetical protein
MQRVEAITSVERRWGCLLAEKERLASHGVAGAQRVDVGGGAGGGLAFLHSVP